MIKIKILNMLYNFFVNIKFFVKIFTLNKVLKYIWLRIIAKKKILVPYNLLFN